MNLALQKQTKINTACIALPGSKSISNRILIIKALSNLKFDVLNLSDSDDTERLKKAIQEFEKSSVIDVGHAGTDMRFLTAFLALQKGTFELTGSQRLQQRPIKDLVEVLKKLGADISYKNEMGFPPLLITGKKLIGGDVEINGSVSSQFITALLMVAPYFQKGLQLTVTGNLVSKPYINMTIELIRHFGAEVSYLNNIISVKPVNYSYSKNNFFIESDWSAASYYYGIVALSEIGKEINLKYLHKESLQADSVCVKLFEEFGVESQFSENQLIVKKVAYKKQNFVFEYDFTNCPDIAQTMVCVCVALQQAFSFTGLQTLKVKETDRIVALKNEFEKFGIELNATQNSISYTKVQPLKAEHNISVSTYNDHRMAMSFSVLSLLVNNLVITDAEVVSKSYPLFWEHLTQIGVTSTVL